jgi:hypothetical protein
MARVSSTRRRVGSATSTPGCPKRFVSQMAGSGMADLPRAR